MVLAIDFDGTLCDPTHVKPGFRMGEPVPGAIEAMTDLARRGHTLIVFTARDRFQPVIEWLVHFGIPFNRVTNTKDPSMDVFLDDRALRFSTWNRAMTDIHKLERHGYR